MTELAIRVAAAATLIWLGMVLAFLEAPLKFRAEGLELRVGLAIGRIVFRALNITEVAWAVVIASCLTIAPSSRPVLVLAAVTGVLLAVQLLWVRPRLNRRSDRVLAGHDAPRSRAHQRLHRLGGAQTRRPDRPWRRPARMTIPPLTHEGEHHER
jgi:class 3 adenylate cyclase